MDAIDIYDRRAHLRTECDTVSRAIVVLEADGIFVNNIGQADIFQLGERFYIAVLDSTYYNVAVISDTVERHFQLTRQEVEFRQDKQVSTSHHHSIWQCTDSRALDFWILFAVYGISFGRSKAWSYLIIRVIIGVEILCPSVSNVNNHTFGVEISRTEPFTDFAT